MLMWMSKCVCVCVCVLCVCVCVVCFSLQLSSTGQPAVSLITQHPPGVRSAFCRWVAGRVESGGMEGREREKGGREGGGENRKKTRKKEREKGRKQNNWFWWHLERVQTGQRLSRCFKESSAPPWLLGNTKKNFLKRSSTDVFLGIFVPHYRDLQKLLA